MQQVPLPRVENPVEDLSEDYKRDRKPGYRNKLLRYIKSVSYSEGLNSGPMKIIFQQRCIGAIEDSIIVDAANETSQIAKELGRAAKEAKAAKNVLPLVNSIRRNLKAIVRASQGLPLEKCQGSFPLRLV